jgi:dolichol-phosphate mannosyltransferase
VSVLAVAGDGALIVVPTYNERDNIEVLVEAVFRAAPAAHVLVVDDASPDGTGEMADRLAAADPRVHVLHRAGKFGLGTAYLEGFAWGLARDYRWFFETDADLSHDPAALGLFFAAFDRGAEVVVGSRNVRGGTVQGWGPHRHVISKGGSLYARFVLGVSVHDLTTGYKGFTRRALETIDRSRVASNGYSFQIEMSYRALRAGLPLVEVPITFVDRRAGKSKMSAGIVREAMVVVWKLRWAALRGRL